VLGVACLGLGVLPTVSAADSGCAYLETGCPTRQSELKKCKKKRTAVAKKRCRKKAKKLPA
jgi:hypothetical protein